MYYGSLLTQRPTSDAIDGDRAQNQPYNFNRHVELEGTARRDPQSPLVNRWLSTN